jgi:hypothetical protein
MPVQGPLLPRLLGLLVAIHCLNAFLLSSNGLNCKKIQLKMTINDPLLVRAYQGQDVERTPVWLMRQVMFLLNINILSILLFMLGIGRSLYG